MQRALVATLLLQLSAGAFGACSAGYKAKAALAAGTFCSLKTADGASCNSNCCEADVTTCGGALAAVGSTTLACPFDSYRPSGDAWAKTVAFTVAPDPAALKATDKTTWQSKCCTKKATCGAAPACPAGWKAKATVSSTMCATDAASCRDENDKDRTSTCCELDTATCGGRILKLAPATAALRITDGTVGANKMCTDNDASSYIEATVFQDDSLLKKACTGCGAAEAMQAGEKTAFAKACCQTQATCASTHYSCSAGRKKTTDTTELATKCGANANSCVTGPANTYKCCKVNGCGSYETGATGTNDFLIPGGTTQVACEASTYYPGKGLAGDFYWKNKFVEAAAAGTPTAAELKAACCTPKATCKNGLCPSGYKKKANSDKIACTGSAASCAEGATCCEADVTKCGGLTGIACPYGTYNEAHFHVKTGPVSSWTAQATIDAWNNKAATDATKNTACCTPKAVCSGVAATTTPAAATVTPATAIRRYSEHKVAVQTGSDRPMVWLGVGGLIGMSVLMAVQGLRSRMSAETEVAEDNERLLE